MKQLITLIILLSIITIQIKAQDELNCLSSECHDSYMKAENIHAAVEDGCESCHDESSKNHPKGEGNEFELTNDASRLCFDCHDEPDEKLMSHEVFSSGDCISCHSPHSSDNPSLLKSENLGELCADCHDVDSQENMVKHGPAVSGQCTFCHEPHQSEDTTLLKVESPQLCFNCHTDKQEMLKLTTVHAAYEGSCTDCHTPHSAKNEFLVKEEIPTLCLECHGDMDEEFKTAKTVHKIINQEKSCISCHLPHASETASLLVKEGKELCYSCHNKEYKSKDRTLNNIYKIVTESKYKHEAVSSGQCTDCHFSHSSDNFYLLNAKFPFGSYAEGVQPENFSQCFQCHESAALTMEKTTSATNFRDGDINMHYLHISKNKGRNCILCHNSHGANKQHLIAKTVKFGNWQMPLNYKKVENGGSCAPGCHSKLKYDRAKEE